MSDDEFDVDELFAAEAVQDTNNEQDEFYRHQINKIKETFARHPTEFELLALSVLPLPEGPHAYQRNLEGAQIKCCKKAFQILLSCQNNDDIIGLHEAGSLLQIVKEEPSQVQDYSAMPSTPPLFLQYNQPASAYKTSSISNDPFNVAQSMNVAGDEMQVPLAAAYSRRHSVGGNPPQPGYTQYSNVVRNPFTAVLRTPYTNRVMNDLQTPRYAPSFGAANHTSPSPSHGKRAFSSTYPSSNAMITSESDYTPSPKRRGSLCESADGEVIQNTSQGATGYPASLQRDSAQIGARQTTPHASAQAATHQGIQHPVVDNGTSKPAGPGDTLKYAKYYRYLAEKNNIKCDEIPKKEADPPTYISPYATVTTPGSHDQRQGSQSTPVPARNPSTSTLTGNSGAQGMNPTLADQYQGTLQQFAGPNNQAMSGRSEQMRQSTEDHRDRMRTQHLEIMKQRQTNVSQNNGQAFANAYAMAQPEYGAPRSSTGAPNSNPYAPTHQTAPGNMHSNSFGLSYQPVPGNVHQNLYAPPRQLVPSNAHQQTLQGTSTPQNPYAGNSNLELSRRMAEEHAQKSRLLSATDFTAGRSGYAATRNAPMSLSSMQGLQPDGLWQSQSMRNPFSGLPGDMGAVQPYNSARVEAETVGDLFTNEASFPPPSAQYTTDHHHESNYDSTGLLSMPQIPMGEALETKPKSKVYKVSPKYRDAYDSLVASLRAGAQILTDLPVYLMSRAKKEAGVYPMRDGSDSDDDSEYQVRPKPPPYQRIETTASTGSLPNINQPYTGSAGSMPFYVKHMYPDYPGPVPPIPGTTPTKKTSQSKKPTPTSKTKKTPTPRKSRAKKTAQSNEQTTAPRAMTPRPTTYNFSGMVNDGLISNSTLENMMAGNYAEFFASPEEETKWKQDAVAQVFAERGTPSKYQLKKDEQERKRLEKDAK
ncbi:hypothetical protein IFR05_009926 [Cadophora sp. M221]|nr:hypothetical protein IFR05_009926 [Cadophora sp. M221]